MDLVEALYRPLYDEWGDASAVLTVNAVAYPITAIDRTEGLTVGAAPLVRSTAPLASVIEADVTAQGLTRDQLDNAGLLLNGVSYTVTSVERMPHPAGPGELYLYLEAAT